MMRAYLVVCEDAPRCESRVLRVFDHQQIAVASFVSMRGDGKVHMKIAADAGGCGESRLMALLMHLEGMLELRSSSLEEDVAVCSRCPILCRSAALR